MDEDRRIMDKFQQIYQDAWAEPEWNYNQNEDVMFNHVRDKNIRARQKNTEAKKVQAEKYREA